MKKILLLGFILICFGFIGLTNFGLINEEILIAGTGSMYPTFPKSEKDTEIKRANEIVAWPKMKTYPGGVTIFGIQLFSHVLNHADIVDFENDKTDKISKEKYGQKAGFVKRVIGLPGDVIEIKDGFVLRNGVLLRESYTAIPRSTAGASFLADCTKLTIPQNKVFVMGDNRKASLDSRHELGLVDIRDISHVLPYLEQNEYKKVWRNSSNDEEKSYQVTLNAQEFISLLNDKRQKEGVLPLISVPSLSTSAIKRADTMIKTEDFSVEATKSGYTIEDATQDSGYSNILYAETVSQGYYTAQELLENIFQFSQTKKLALNPEYQDIGVGVVLGQIRNCPVQAIVLHLGGYKPPNYEASQIDSWQKLVDILNEAIPTWERLKGQEEINQADLTTLLSSLYLRRDNATRVLNKMKKNLWLTDEERKFADQDNELAKKEEELIEKLNP